MMTESLFSKESIQLFLSLIDNSLQTSCIQFINDCRKSCLRINRTCQQVVIVFFPSSIYICNFVLNRFGIEYEAQACRRGCSFILLFTCSQASGSPSASVARMKKVPCV